MTDKQIRRSIRKFIKRYGMQDTRKITTLFANAYSTTKQRIAGNLRTMKYDEKTINISTYIPCCHSVMTTVS